MTKAITSIAAALLIVPSVAHAEGPVPVAGSEGATFQTSDSGVRSDAKSSAEGKKDHEGLMLRLSGGVAAFGGNIKPDQGAEFGVGGVGPSLGAALGASVAPNLAVHLDLMTVGTIQPGTEDTAQNEYANPDGFGMDAIGAGVTYYFMPLDLGITAAALYADVAMKNEEEDMLKTDGAVFGKLDVTKEWAVSDNWGLGIGGSLYAGHGFGSDDVQDFKADLAGATINFTATYF
jgi:hypothetical protein